MILRSVKPDLKLGRQLERPVVAGSGPPICPPQHDLNDWIVVEADLEFRPESATDGIVRLSQERPS